AEVAGAGHLLLYHLVPPLPVALVETVFLGDSAKEYSGPITVGEDGMLFTLPAGTDEISLTQTF
ncbi:MAG: MBL fold metallo-hydrolase, partial [Pseudomonadota bacterium]